MKTAYFKKNTVLRAAALMLCAAFVFALPACEEADAVSVETEATVTTTETVTTEATTEETTVVTEPPEPPYGHVIEDVPYIYQRDKYPNGCEAVSTVMVLNYFGFDVTPEEFIYGSLDINGYHYAGWYGNSPWDVYLGDPCTSWGMGCYAPVIVRAIRKCIGGVPYKILELYDTDIEELCETYIANDIPVIFWATLNMEESYPGETWWVHNGNSTFTWIYPEHCLTLVGYDEENYIFNDPWVEAYLPYPKADVKKAYEAMGSQAVVLMPRETSN